jgi:fructokinase
MAGPFTVVGAGELLWDLLPSGKQLGGAPANFAYHVSLLGDTACVASRLGRDALGAELRRRLLALGLRDDALQEDPTQPTGTVQVAVDAAGQPTYTIVEPVAWDCLVMTPAWRELARRADALCFGSLAQRAATSRATLHALLAATRPACVRVFDVNLRQHFYSAAVLETSLRRTTVLKLNDSELPLVAELLGHGGGDEATQARRLLDAYGLRLVCVTRGSRGCLLRNATEVVEVPGVAVQVADTVGAGDAFTAAMTHHVLRGSSLAVTAAAANRMGAWVAGCTGGTPPADAAVLAQVRR